MHFYLNSNYSSCIPFSQSFAARGNQRQWTLPLLRLGWRSCQLGYAACSISGPSSLRCSSRIDSSQSTCRTCQQLRWHLMTRFLWSCFNKHRVKRNEKVSAKYVAQTGRRQLSRLSALSFSPLLHLPSSVTVENSSSGMVCQQLRLLCNALAASCPMHLSRADCTPGCDEFLNKWHPASHKNICSYWYLRIVLTAACQMIDDFVANMKPHREYFAMKCIIVIPILH